MSAFTRFVTPPLGVAVIAIALGGSLPLVSSLSSAHAAAPPADEQTIIHVLNRVAFGPSTGDVEKVRQMGIADYIDQQLRPDRIPDGAMASKLEGLRTVGLSSREIADRFVDPNSPRPGPNRRRAPTTRDLPSDAPFDRLPSSPRPMSVSKWRLRMCPAGTPM